MSSPSRDFVSQVQAQLLALAGPGTQLCLSITSMNLPLTVRPGFSADDALSDDAMENNFAAVTLPPPELGNLQDIEQLMRMASATQTGRDSLTRFIIGEEYISKLIPLVSMAEDLESLTDLHRLCNIMKTLILLNDTAIIEHVVTDEIILGVVGALECRSSICNMRGTRLMADWIRSLPKMTPTFRATRRTIVTTSPMKPNTRKWCAYKTPTSENAYITPTVFNTSRTSCLPASSMTPPSPS